MYFCVCICELIILLKCILFVNNDCYDYGDSAAFDDSLLIRCYIFLNCFHFCLGRKC